MENVDDMNAYQKAMAIYRDWEERVQWDAQARLLTRLLTQRFGEVTPEAAERIQYASSDTLLRWAERLLTAKSLDDVFF